MNEKDCNKTKCRFFDKKMSQSCARALNRHSDIPYASICKDMKRTRPRMGKHERLLRALLNSMNKSDLVHHSAFGLLSESNFNKCIAIKQAMEKKGGK